MLAQKLSILSVANDVGIEFFVDNGEQILANTIYVRPLIINRLIRI